MRTRRLFGLGLLCAAFFSPVASAREIGDSSEVVIVRGQEWSFDKAASQNPMLQRLLENGAITAPVELRDDAGVTWLWTDGARPAEVLGPYVPAENIEVRQRGQLLARDRSGVGIERGEYLERVTRSQVEITTSFPRDLEAPFTASRGQAALVLDLPGGESVSFDSYDVQAGQISAESRGSRFSGTILPRRASDDYIELSGTIDANGRRYTVDSLGDGRHAVIEIANTDAWRDEPLRASLEERHQGSAEDVWHAGCGTQNDGVITVGWFADVRSYAALQADVNMGRSTRIETALRLLNTSLGAAVFKPVNLLNAAFTGVDVPALFQATSDFLYPEIAYRSVWTAANDQHVDLVVFVGWFDDGADRNGDDEVCGWAPDTNSRVVVVEYSCLVDGRATLQHEIGHRFGGQHDRACCPSCVTTPSYATDWRGDGQGTWLAQWLCPSGGKPLSSRFSQFSSRKGRYGDAVTADVTRLVDERLSRVAGFGNCDEVRAEVRW